VISGQKLSGGQWILKEMRVEGIIDLSLYLMSLYLKVVIQPKAYRRVPIRGCAPIGTRRKCGLGEEIRDGVSSALRAARYMRFPLETSLNPRNPLVSKRRPFVGVVRYNPLVQST